MSAARTQILSTIRTALGRTEPNTERRKMLEERLKTSEPSNVSQVIPARGQGSRVEQIECFMAEARRVDATVERLKGMADIPLALVRYLKNSNQISRIKVAPQRQLQDVPWSSVPKLDIECGPATPDDPVSLAMAFAGIAETGTLAMVSSPESPISLHFLAETQIIVVGAEDIVGAYEDVWTLLRLQNKQGSTPKTFMPRAVNLITGPSRTADIEQTLLLGAHGPKNLHILVIGSGDE